ncbi:hypothetical protein TrLO_g10628 [Triparma laevis f. longispina]|uniref:TLDc domain-containing protein n=1 Tax=Triparma laevis f. longispina TaxID=1714387 RepID=A0A9W7C9E5_9STRA|nr:hypothetical protein TrLO_g10628 [Triparma laevis f. longispina]
MLSLLRSTSTFQSTVHPNRIARSLIKRTPDPRELRGRSRVRGSSSTRVSGFLDDLFPKPSDPTCTPEPEPEPEPDTRDPVEKLFNFFFGAVEDSPQGLQRFDSKRFPEQYPCTKTEWAEVLPNDIDKENGPMLSYLPQRYRPMLKNTNMETRDMVLTYSSKSDGWDYTTFHEKLDRQGASLVVLITKDNEVVGGYNPKGWCGYGEYRGSIAAFLFRFNKPVNTPDDNKPTKLQKVGGAGLAQLDFPETAISFGSDSLVVPLNGSKQAMSKLGSYYERFEDGTNTIFRDKGSKELKEVRVYTGVYEEGEYVPFSDAEPFALN